MKLNFMQSILREMLWDLKLVIRAKEINERLEAFMEEHIYPRERDYDEFTSDQNNLMAISRLV